MKENGNWTEIERRFLMENLRTMPIHQIAQRIGRSERAVRLYMFRHGIPIRPQTKCPTIPQLLEIKFGNANWFRPTREFYEQVGITQKRWQDLRMRYAAPTQEELVRISRVLHLQTEEALQLVDSVQLELFSDQNKQP